MSREPLPEPNIKSPRVQQTNETEFSREGGTPHDRIMHLQRTLGNRRVTEMIRAKRISKDGRILGVQPKLTVGAVDDPSEREAEQMARDIMATPDSAIRRSESKNQEVGKQEEGRAFGTIQLSAVPTGGESFEPGAEFESGLNAKKGSGSVLPDHVRSYLEPRFGVDFSHVRVHTDGGAAELNRAVGAEAFTHGSEIYYGAARGPSNLELTAHELTHVVQQGGGQPLRRARLEVEEQQDRPEVRKDEVPKATRNPQDSSRVLNHRNADRRVIAPAAVSRLDRKCTCEGKGECVSCQNAEQATVQRSASSNSPTSTKGVAQKAQKAVTAPQAIKKGPGFVAVVDDDVRVVAGQMTRTAFLSALRDSLIHSCDEALKPFGRTAQGCPLILRTLERCSSRPAASLLRLLHAFAHPAPSANAQTIIQLVSHLGAGIAHNLGVKHGSFLQAKSDVPGHSLGNHNPIAIRSQLGSGHPLPPASGRHMERFFGQNFNAVRIHTDHVAQRLNTSLGARAFTVGHDIAFSADSYQPGSPAGDKLLAHELTHVIQQRNDSTSKSPTTNDHADLENKADRAASAVTSDRTLQDETINLKTTGPQIQRWPAVIVAGALTLEAAPEVAVVAEVAAVSTEVVVADGAIVATADIAAPAVADAVAPAVADAVSTGAEVATPSAIESTASVTQAGVTQAASTSAASNAATATAVGIGAIASTSGDSSEPEPCEAPTGLSQFDPIPMLWYKPWNENYYPSPISMGGHYYDRDNPEQHMPFGEPIGVNAAMYRPYIDKVMQLDAEERGPNAARFRAVTERHGFDWTGLQADHVQDLQFSGPDSFDNLWPLDRNTNLSAGTEQNQNQPVTFCEGPNGPLHRDMSIRQMRTSGLQYYGRHFVIAGFVGV